MDQVKSWKMKICLIGEAAVGKTSLIKKFVLDKFDDEYLATIGTKTSKKTININNDHTSYNLTLMIWDILGQRNFETLQKVAYCGANGAFIVLDLTRKETLTSFDHWLSSLYKVAGEIPIVVLANKNDLTPEFGEYEIKSALASHGFPYYETSAKTGENIDCAFQALGESMIKVWGEEKAVAKPVESKVMVGTREAEQEKKLTPLEAEDIILARYCQLYKDTDFAMAIIRKQIKRAGVDFKHPTVKGLTKFTEFLLEAASNYIDAARLEKERRIYENLIARVG